MQGFLSFASRLGSNKVVVSGDNEEKFRHYGKGVMFCAEKLQFKKGILNSTVIDGVRQGPFRLTKSSSHFLCGKFVDGVVDGDIKTYKQGNLVSSKSYNKGVLDGDWVLINYKGINFVIATYSDGVLVRNAKVDSMRRGRNFSVKTCQSGIKFTMAYHDVAYNFDWEWLDVEIIAEAIRCDLPAKLMNHNSAISIRRFEDGKYVSYLRGIPYCTLFREIVEWMVMIMVKFGENLPLNYSKFEIIRIGDTSPEGIATFVCSAPEYQYFFR